MALKQSIDALVVGAGPVGLVAALALARAGNDHVEIIDEAERRTGLSYALALHPETLAALEELGVAARLIAAGNRVDRVALYDGATRKAELAIAALHQAHPFVLVVPQNELERVLLEALAEAGVEVRWRHRLRRLDISKASNVACTIDRIDTDTSGYAVAGAGGVVGKSFEREIPLVIGADGHASLVRRLLGIERRATGPSGTVAVFELEGEAPPADRARDSGGELRITFAGGLRSVWWPLPADRVRIGFELAAGEEPATARGKTRLPSIVPWLATTLDAGHLAELVRERLPWHAAPSGRLMWSASVSFERAQADSYGSGRVWLAGDAAHLAFPFGVQSMNTGIVEARQLALHCARVLEGREPVAALTAWGNEHRSHWQGMLKAVAEGAKIAGASAADAWLGEHASAIVEALPVAIREPERLFPLIR
jgi:2-polyprenyl-6-methoxyphenol hydroxylase-like FAD-dependent oxidoreductase